MIINKSVCLLRSVLFIHHKTCLRNAFYSTFFKKNSTQRKGHNKTRSQYPPKINKISQQQISAISNNIKLKEIKDQNQDPTFISLLRTSKDIEDVLSLKQKAFSSDSKHLAAYLFKLSTYLTMQSFQKCIQDINWINSKINSISSQLSMTVQEFLQILTFHSQLKEISATFNIQFSSTFQHRAAVLAASFLHNNQFTLNQAVYAFDLLNRYGGTQLLFSMNFIKFMKRELYKNSSQKISLSQLLIILNSKFTKRNEIIVENTLYDQVLHYLLSNLSILIKGQNLLTKVQTLCILLKIDSKNNYKSDSGEKRLWVLRLFGQFNSVLQKENKDNWIDDLFLHKMQTESNKTTIFQVVHILESIDFAMTNMMQHDNFLHQFKKISQVIYNKFCHFGKKLIWNQTITIHSSQSIELFFRFYFNRQIVSNWINHIASKNQLLSFIIKLPIDFQNQSYLFPLVDYINQQAFINKKLHLQFVHFLFLAFQKKGVILCSLSLYLVKYFDVKNGLKFIKEVNMSNSVIDPKMMMSYILLARYYGMISGNKIQILAHLNPLVQQKQDMSQYIINLYKATTSFRSFSIYKSALSLLQQHCIKIKIWLSKKESNMNNNVLFEQLYFIAQIIFINLCQGVQISGDLRQLYDKIFNNDIIKYKLLSLSYCEQFPIPQAYHKFMANQMEFKTNMEYLLGIFDKDQKYSYFIWDLFIKRYTKQTRKNRQLYFNLLEKYFLRAYNKERLRKVVMATVLTNYISSGVITAPRPILQSLFNYTIDELIKSEENIEYHYHCYLQIVLNAISADILDPKYFDMIMQHSLKKDPNMKHTCSLMLIYGSHLKSRSSVGGVISFETMTVQIGYLKYLMNNDLIRLRKITNGAQEDVDKVVKNNDKKSLKNPRYIHLTSCLISILFSFGRKQILRFQQIVLEYIRQNNNYGEWRCMVLSYVAQNYLIHQKRQLSFRTKINNIMIQKLIYFKKLDLIMQEEEYYFLQKFK